MAPGKILCSLGQTRNYLPPVRKGKRQMTRNPGHVVTSVSTAVCHKRESSTLFSFVHFGQFLDLNLGVAEASITK